MTPIYVTVATNIFSLGTIALQAFSFALILFLIQKKELPLIKKYSFSIIFFVALVSTLGSLFYSEMAGYIPCKLCWYQRILMYPIAIICIIALFKKTKVMLMENVLWLSVIGLIISGYHYYGQMIHTGILPCNAQVVAAACSYRPFVTFGYITIPLMAFTVFLTVILVILSNKIKGNTTKV